VTETHTAHFVDALGVRRRATFDTVAEALDFQAELRLARRKHGVAALSRGQLTLAAFFNEHYWPRYAATGSSWPPSASTSRGGTCTPTRAWATCACATSP
jgi:hypothetical protein